MVVLAADQMVTSRTLEGTYPNYRQLIPDGFSRTIGWIVVRLWPRWSESLCWRISTTMS